MAKKKAKVQAPEAQATQAATPATPPHPMANLRSEIDRVFERFLHDPWAGGLELLRTPEWSPFGRLGQGLEPHADLHETDDGYALSVELPGLDEKDIEINVTDDVLTLKGEKREEKSSGEGESHFSERRYGSFRRSFTMPRGVEAAHVQATFAKGVLRITMPKSEEARATSRRVEVRTD